MANSYIEYTSGLTETTFSVPFKYISIDDVYVKGWDGTEWSQNLSVASRSANASTITLSVAPSGTYTKIRLYRATSTAQLVDFQNGSRLSERDLDTAYQQGLFVAQEVSEDANTKQFESLTENTLLLGTSLVNFASSTLTGDAATVTFALSFTPQVSTPQAYLVAIDGVLQSPVDAYTISIDPAEITFAEAPPASAEIVVTTAAGTSTAVPDNILVTADGSTTARDLSERFADVVNVKDFGAVGDGVTDDTTAFESARDSNAASIQVPEGTYVLSDFVMNNSNQQLIGLGKPTLLAKAAVAGTPMIMSVSGDNVQVENIIFDGNTLNISSFNNVTQVFQAENVRFDNCEWIDCRGIALFVNAGVNVGVTNSKFESCGIYNVTSGDDADRKQALAFSGTDKPYANFNEFNNVGLDNISMATNCTDIQVIGNKIGTGYSAGIYVSSSDSGSVSNNTINTGTTGGNGIDIPNSTHIAVTGNVVYGCGASGILVALDCENITLTGNICYNNIGDAVNQHEGGICLSFPSGSTLKHITLSGNICYDNQGAGNVTQEYGIGIKSGGDFENIKIDQSNVLQGYDAAGVENAQKAFQDTSLGMCGYPIHFNLGNGDEVELLKEADRFGEFMVFQVNGSYLGKFFVRETLDPISTYDPSSQFETTDTGSTQAVYRNGTSGTINLKNNTGVNRTYAVLPVNAGKI